MYNSTGRFDDALLLLGEAERLAAKAVLVYFEVARADIGKGKFAEALRDLDRSSELQGGVGEEATELHLVRGYALIGLTEMPQAGHTIGDVPRSRASSRVAKSPTVPASFSIAARRPPVTASQ